SSWLRVIPDVDAPVYPLLSRDGSPLDLTGFLTRAVSPIHLEYLRNMRVAASVTLSLKEHGRLWGLIACHHMTPRHLTRTQREVCEILARFTSARIQEAQ